MKPWYRHDGGRRIEHDKALVAARFPRLTYRVDERRGTVEIVGPITLKSESGIPEHISVRIALPPGYPREEPAVFDAGRRFLPHSPDRHFFSNGRCCLWLPPESRWSERDRDALDRFLDEVLVFFERQLIYDVVGYFPGEDRAHGIAGFLEYFLDAQDGEVQVVDRLLPLIFGSKKVSRNAPCPCGSGRKFKRCHSDFVETMQSHMRRTYGD